MNNDTFEGKQPDERKYYDEFADDELLSMPHERLMQLQHRDDTSDPDPRVQSRLDAIRQQVADEQAAMVPPERHPEHEMPVYNPAKDNLGKEIRYEDLKGEPRFEPRRQAFPPNYLEQEMRKPLQVLPPLPLPVDHANLSRAHARFQRAQKIYLDFVVNNDAGRTPLPVYHQVLSDYSKAQADMISALDTALGQAGVL